jgi:hypothetical protein
MELSTFDPCLFICTKVMCICYVDDLICCTPDESGIGKLENQLIFVGVLLEHERDAARFLGVGLKLIQLIE